jgi:phosphoribosylamine--glycine ligase
MGVEIAAGAFFNGHEFIHPICVSFEHKKLFAVDIGRPRAKWHSDVLSSRPTL